MDLGKKIVKNPSSNTVSKKSLFDKLINPISELFNLNNISGFDEALNTGIPNSCSYFLSEPESTALQLILIFKLKYMQSNSFVY